MLSIVDKIKELPWNTSGEKWPQRKLSKVKYIVVHQALAEAKVTAINKYHISKDCHIAPGKGAPHICYHFFIEADGTVVQCNELTDKTSQVKDKNTASLGICLSGKFAYPEDPSIKGEPTLKQIVALEQLIDYLNTKVKATLYGHSELQEKPSCPGTSLMNYIKSKRSNKR